MRHIFLLIALLLAPFVEGFGENLQLGAMLKIDSVTHDFGRVSRKGDNITHTFIAHNVGDAPLVITEGVTTCSCIKVKHPKRPIPPKGSGEVEVKYELGRKDIGPFHKIIQLHSNSSNGGCQILTIHGISIEE